MKHISFNQFAEGRFEVKIRSEASVDILLADFLPEHLFELHIFVRSNAEKLFATSLVRDKGYEGALFVLIQPSLSGQCSMLIISVYENEVYYPVRGISVLKMHSGKLFRTGMDDFPINAISWSDAFENFAKKLETASLPMSSIIKTWSYLSCDRSGSGAVESFGSFNRTRSTVFEKILFQIDPIGSGEKAFPANTGVGNLGAESPEISGLGFVPESMDVVITSLENPMQLSATKYGSEAGRSEPALFSRAVAIRCNSIELVAVAGTASVVGSKTTNIGDIAEQSKTTLNLVQELLAQVSRKGIKDLAYAIIFVQDEIDGELILPILRNRLGNVPTLVLRAPLTRSDLLVEIDCLLFGPLQ
jgi:enamine deaminase RidA (YjgF/YER057c/UK114 family)